MIHEIFWLSDTRSRPLMHSTFAFEANGKSPRCTFEGIISQQHTKAVMTQLKVTCQTVSNTSNGTKHRAYQKKFLIPLDLLLIPLIFKHYLNKSLLGSRILIFELNCCSRLSILFTFLLKFHAHYPAKVLIMAHSTQEKEHDDVRYGLLSPSESISDSIHEYPRPKSRLHLSECAVRWLCVVSWIISGILASGNTYQHFATKPTQKFEQIFYC